MSARPVTRGSCALVAAALASACSAGTGGDAGGDSDLGPTGWRTDGQRIIDPDGRQRILQGINVANGVKPAPYDCWAVEEDYARLQGWGFSAIRLLTSWAAIMPEPDVIDQAYLAKYDQRVAWAAEHDLLVIIDMHQDVFGEGFGFNGAPRWACDEALYATFVPLQPWFRNYFAPEVQACFGRFWEDEALQDQFIAAAATIAGRYANDDAVIGLDLFNEPMFGDTSAGKNFERQQLQPFYERLITGVRAAAPRSLIFAEPFVGIQILWQTDLEPFAADNVVFAPHFYQSSVHDQQSYDGDPTYIEDTMAVYQQAATDLGVPWWLGEWGGPSATTNFPAYLKDILAETERHQVGTAQWAYDPEDDGFGPLNTDHSEKTEVVDVLARVYPKAVAGELVSFRFDDATDIFTMTLRTEAGVTGPTVLAFPEARHYPDGFVVESTDADGAWSYATDAALAELSFTIDPAVAEHTLTISPAP